MLFHINWFLNALLSIVICSVTKLMYAYPQETKSLRGDIFCNGADTRYGGNSSISMSSHFSELLKVLSIGR